MRRIVLICVGILFLASCAPATHTPTLQPTNTLLPPTGTPSPSKTSLPTRTLLPTWTPKIAITPGPTITPPVIEPISLSSLALNETNISQMQRLSAFGTGEPTDMAWSPDGKTFAVATTRGIWLYDGETFQDRGFIDVNDEVSALTFSSDGQILALAIHGQVELWSVPSRQKIKDIASGLKSIYSLAYGKGGQIAFFGDVTWNDVGDYMLELWDADSGREIFSKHMIGVYTEVVFSPDGHLMAYKDNEGLKLIDSETAALISTMDFSSIFPDSFGFFPDGSALFIIGQTGTGIWNFQGRSRTFFEDCIPPVTSTYRFLLCDKDNGSFLIDLASGTRYQEIDYSVNHIKTALSSDGRFLADISLESTIKVVRTIDSSISKSLSFTIFSGDQYKQIFALGKVEIDDQMIDAIATVNGNEIKLWNVANGESILTLNSDSPLIGLAFSPDEHSLASVDESHVLKLWDLTNATYYLSQLEYASGPIGFSPDGRKLAYYLPSNAVQESYGVSGQKTLLDLQSSKTDSVGPDLTRGSLGEKYQFLSNGNLLNLSFQDGLYSLMNTTTHEIVLPLSDIQKSLWYSNDVSDLDATALSSDGSLFAYAKYNGMIEVWDLTSKKLIRSFQGQPPVSNNAYSWSTISINFSPQSNLLVTVGADDTTRLWNALTGTELRRLNVCCYADFTPDGRYLITAGDGVIRVWGLPQP